MALSDAYATKEQYRAQAGKQSSDDDVTIEQQLLAISRYIDVLCRRKLGFGRDGTVAGDDEVTRTYVMGRGTVLDIHDHVSVSAVAIGNHYSGVYDAALATTAYVLLPRNAPTGPEPEPYRQIEFLSSVPGEDALVRVTGIGGWPAVPAAIVSATVELTAILRMESDRATYSVNELNHVLSASRAAMDIIPGLIRAYGPRSRVLA